MGPAAGVASGPARSETIKESAGIERRVSDLIEKLGMASLLEALIEVCECQSAICRRESDHAESSRSRAANATDCQSWLLVAGALEEAKEVAEQEGL